MRDCIPDYMCNVRIRQLVDHLAASAALGHQLGGSGHTQVLADERLRDIEGIDDLVDAGGVARQQVYERKAARSGQGAKEVTGGVVLLDVRMRYGKRGSRMQLLSHHT